MLEYKACFLMDIQQKHCPAFERAQKKKINQETPSKILKTVLAMANGPGGVLFIGISEGGSIKKMQDAIRRRCPEPGAGCGKLVEDMSARPLAFLGDPIPGTELYLTGLRDELAFLRRCSEGADMELWIAQVEGLLRRTFSEDGVTLREKRPPEKQQSCAQKDWRHHKTVKLTPRTEAALLPDAPRLYLVDGFPRTFAYIVVPPAEQPIEVVWKEESKVRTGYFVRSISARAETVFRDSDDQERWSHAERAELLQERPRSPLPSPPPTSPPPRAPTQQEPIRPAFFLDRTQQKADIEGRLALPIPGHAFLITGELDQGHARLSRYVQRKLEQGHPQRRWLELKLAWPTACAAPEARYQDLLGALDRMLPGEHSPAQTLRALAKDGHGFFVRHELSQPTIADAELMTRWLEEVWSGVAEELPGKAIVLTFEIWLPQSAGWWSRLSLLSLRMHWGVRAIIKAARRISASQLEVVSLPALASLQLDDIQRHLPLTPGSPAALALARQIHRLSAGGRFEQVLKHLPMFSGADHVL